MALKRIFVLGSRGERDIRERELFLYSSLCSSWPAVPPSAALPIRLKLYLISAYLFIIGAMSPAYRLQRHGRSEQDWLLCIYMRSQNVHQLWLIPKENTASRSMTWTSSYAWPFYYPRALKKKKKKREKSWHSDSPRQEEEDVSRL